MVAAKNNMKRKNNANNSGPKRFNKQGAGNQNQRRPPAGFRPQFPGQFQQNPIPNPGYVDFNEPVAAPPPQQMRQNNGPRKNFQNKQQGMKQGNGNFKNGGRQQRGNFGGGPPMRRPMPPPPHAAFGPMPMHDAHPMPPMPGFAARPFPGGDPNFRRPFFPPRPIPQMHRRMPPHMAMGPMPPFLPPMGGPMRHGRPMPAIPIPPRRRSGAIQKPINNKNVKKGVKPAAQNPKKKPNKTHGPTYPLDKPWVSVEIKEAHAKKIDIENRLKGNRNDELFAEYKKQRDLFVALYDAAKLEHIGKNKKEVNQT